MCRRQSRERSIIANWDKFARKDTNDIPGNASNKSQYKFTAGKDGSGDADLVSVLGFPDRDINTVDNGTGEIIGNQASPNFLFDGNGLTSVEFSKANGVFEGAERGFDAPAARIDFHKTLGREVIRRKIGDNRFILAGGDLEANDANRQLIIGIAAVLDEIESGVLANKADITFGKRANFRLAANDDQAHRDVKSLVRGNINMVQKALRADILGTKKKELTLLDDMGHIVIGAEAAIGHKDGISIRRERMAIDDGSESGIFILLSDRLDDGVGISIGIQVKESGQMDAVAAFCRISLGGEIILRRKTRIAQEGERGAIGGKEPILRIRRRDIKRLVEAV